METLGEKEREGVESERDTKVRQGEKESKRERERNTKMEIESGCKNKRIIEREKQKDRKIYSQLSRFSQFSPSKVEAHKSL